MCFAVTFLQLKHFHKFRDSMETKNTCIKYNFFLLSTDGFEPPPPTEG
jgi:hypothetical protein